MFHPDECFILHGSLPTNSAAIVLPAIQESFLYLCGVGPTQTGSPLPLVPRPPDSLCSIIW